MSRSEKENYPRIDRSWKKAREVNVPIILEELAVKELPLSLEDGDMCKLSVRTDPTNEDLTCVRQKISILDHPKNILEVLRARLAISQILTGKNITTGPNHYRFIQTFLDAEALRILDLNLTEFCHETVSNLILVMDHVVTNFRPR